MKQHLSTGIYRQFYFFVMLLVITTPGHAEIKILGSQVITKTTEIKDQVWPQVEAKALIKASPLTSVAIFAAYDYQKNYIPNLLKSRVSFEKVNKETNDTHVTYLMDMPWPLSDSKYIHGHKLSRPSQDSYKVSWYMVKSDSAEDVKGYALFEPHPAQSGSTLMTYVSLVTPKSFLAGIFKKVMIGDVVKSIEAIRNTTENLVKEKSPLPKEYRDKIENVLAGRPAYLK